MKALLITIRLKDPKIDYTYLFETIKDYECVTINNWTYMLKTKLSPKNIYAALRPHLKEEDTLLIFTLKQQWQGRGPNELINWILKHF